MNSIMKIENLIDEIDNIEYKDTHCCYPGCQQQSIRSHTISKNHLKKAGLDLPKTKTIQPAISLIVNKIHPKLTKRVSKDTFSTFIGFCEYHDHKLFEPIDSFDGLITNETAVLVHYRNICCGINHIRTQHKRLEHLLKQNYIEDTSYNRKVNKQINMIFRKEEPLLKRLNYCLTQHLIRKEKLEQMIKNNCYDHIEFLSLIGGPGDPIFCGRSSYPLHKKIGLFKTQGYSLMPWITYMTLLTSQTNTLVFCWLKNDAIYTKELNNLIQNEAHKEMIETLAFGYSDSLAFEGTFYNKHAHVIDPIIQNIRTY